MSEVIVMDVVISTLATFWLLLALSFVLIKRASGYSMMLPRPKHVHAGKGTGSCH